MPRRKKPNGNGQTPKGQVNLNVKVEPDWNKMVEELEMLNDLFCPECQQHVGQLCERLSKTIQIRSEGKQ